MTDLPADRPATTTEREFGNRTSRKVDEMLTVKFPPRLRVVPELSAYELNVGALTDAHRGRTVVVQHNGVVVASKLDFLAESVHEPLIVLQLGDLRLALHPAEVVTVVPREHKVTLTITEQPGP